MEEKEVIKNKRGEPRPRNAGTQAQLKAEVGFSATREGPVQSSCHCDLLIGNNWDCLKPQSPELAAAASTRKHLSPSPMATVQPPPPPAGGARSTPSTQIRRTMGGLESQRHSRVLGTSQGMQGTEGGQGRGSTLRQHHAMEGPGKTCWN